jgi:hypothetical protein
VDGDAVGTSTGPGGGVAVVDAENDAGVDGSVVFAAGVVADAHAMTRRATTKVLGAADSEDCIGSPCGSVD